jgi:hypothetical protein
VRSLSVGIARRDSEEAETAVAQNTASSYMYLMLLGLSCQKAENVRFWHPNQIISHRIHG